MNGERNHYLRRKKKRSAKRTKHTQSEMSCKLSQRNKKKKAEEEREKAVQRRVDDLEDHES